MQDDIEDRYGSRSRRGQRRRRQRARRRLLLLVVALLVGVVAVAAVVLARGSGGEDAAGDGGTGGAKVAASARPSPRPSTPPPEVWAASASDPVRVWIGGDSMGGELGFGLASRLERTGVFEPVTFYKESSGICRYDFYDWGRRIRNVMRTDRPQAAVIMLGTNDTQSVWKGGKWIAYGTSAWKKAYERRVGAIIDAMLRGGARRVYWVGMPIMGDGWRNARMRVINRIFERQAERHPGAEYVDAWSLYARPDGSYDPSLRAGDGVHFTVEGQELLAKTVARAIARDWMPEGPPAASPSPAP